MLDVVEVSRKRSQAVISYRVGWISDREALPTFADASEACVRRARLAGLALLLLLAAVAIFQNRATRVWSCQTFLAEFRSQPGHGKASTGSPHAQTRRWKKRKGARVKLNIHIARICLASSTSSFDTLHSGFFHSFRPFFSHPHGAKQVPKKGAIWRNRTSVCSGRNSAIQALDHNALKMWTRKRP